MYPRIKTSILNLVCSISMLAFTPIANAQLVGMANDEMTDISGQGGADLSWTLSLNHRYAKDLSLKNISVFDTTGKATEAFYTYSCTDNVFCRLAIAPNNHKDAAGNKKWLVFKGIQGTLQIDQFSLDGATIINRDGNPQTALQISFFDDKPLKIRNLGFNTLAVETGDAGVEGYANNMIYSTYTEKKSDGTTVAGLDVPTFDKNTEKGFMGLNMHGNLHMSGNLKIFSFNCTGAGTARC